MTIKHQRATTRAHSRHSQQMQSGQQRAHYSAGHQKAAQSKGDIGGEQQQDDGFIPLPIQTFLWRQTSPFVRPLLGKARDLAQIEQRDACKLFERIIITNNIWGQSPSLEEAIDSIDRWRLIRVSFPFVLQCTAALLNNKLIKDHNLNRLGGNEAKMMYTLQWILMDASEECADSENEAKSKATNVALAASLLKPCEPSTGQLKSDSSSEFTDQARANRQVSMSSASFGVQVQSELQEQNQQQAEEQSRVAGTSLIPVLVPLSQAQPATGSTSLPNSYLLPISSIQMFVYYFAPMMDGLKHSDFLSSNQRLEIGTALWEPLFHHQLPDIHCLKARIKKAPSSELAHPPAPSSKAPVEQKPKANEGSQQQQPPASSHYDRRHSSSVFSSSAHFGDVFLGEPAQAVAPARSPQVPAPSSAFQRDSQLAGDQHSAGTTQPPNAQAEPATNSTNPDYATYLDVAVLRCLFISDWQESGVHWALNYLANRFNEDSYKFDKKLDSLDANLAIWAREARLKRRSKSLSCVCDDDLRRSLTLKHECAGVQADKVLGVSRTRKGKGLQGRTSAGSITDDDSKQDKRAAKAQESRFLNVSGSDAGGEPDADDASAPPKIPLSFSASMQTLATQIRKTSKRVKKSSGDQQSSESVTADANGEVEPPCGRSMRRSSSAEELTSGQLELLRGRQQQQQQPVIKIVETQADEQHSEKKHKKKKSGAKEWEQQQQSKAAASGGPNEPRARQYLMQSLYARSLRRFERLTRSQSVPKSMHLVHSASGALRDQLDESEPHEADFYVDELGRIDPLVVLKILHLVSQRESACSLRVCDRILSLMNRLLKINVLAGHAHRSQLSLAKLQRVISLLPSRQHEQRPAKPASQQALQLCSKPNKLVHRILIDIVFRLNKHLGCPNHCGAASTVDRHHQHQHRAQQQAGRQTFALGGGAKSSMMSGATDSTVALGSNNLRLSLRESLHSLCQHDKRTFIQYVQEILAERNLQQAMDILHNILGFCHSDYSSYLNHRKQQQQQASETPAPGSQAARFGHSATGCSTSAAAAAASATAKQEKPEAVEAVIVSSSLKQLVTSMSKETRVRENAAMHADIRRLINFVRENYNHTFKSVVLSALIDCTRLLNQQRQRDKTRNPSLDRNSSRAATRPSELARNSSEDESSATIVEHQFGREPNELANELFDESELSDGTLAHQARHTSLGSQGRPHSLGAPSTSASMSARGLATSIKQQQQQQSSGISSLSKARKKLEQVFGGKQSDGEGGGGGGGASGKPNSAITRSKAACADDDDSMMSAGQIAEPAGGHSHTKGSAKDIFGSPVHMDASTAQRILLASGHSGASNAAQLGQMNIRIIKQNQLIYNTVKVGMSNFAFLMESCLPGDFLEPALLAALLDLKSPIAIRAAIFLECANFVHRCNRGQWPAWMRMNVAQQHRASNAGFLGTSAGTAAGLLSSKLRKSSSIQRTARNNTLMYRAAGRAFYAWAEAVGARLEELLQQEQEAAGAGRDGQQEPATISEEGDSVSLSSGQQAHLQQRQRATSAESLLAFDVDFLQPTINGDSSPFVLKMAASQLLFEVTTFLRETYRYLPPTIVQHQVAGTKAGDKMSSIYDVSRAVTANRRWSMALSSLGFGQLPATLSALSAAGPTQAISGPQSGNTLRTSAAISEQPERRISFILHETKDEDQQEESSGAGVAGGPVLAAERRLSKCDSIGAAAQQPSLQDSHREGSLNSADTQVEPLRKITAGLPGRHLSQSSASSAVAVAAATLLRSSGIIEGQTHRRKSIKLRKSAKESAEKDRKQTKFAQDFDEELENSSQGDSAGLRRTDSSHSRRRVSGISERSDTSDLRVPQNGHQQQPPELSGNESLGNGSCEEAAPGATGPTCASGTAAAVPAAGYPTASDLNKFEADESKIMSDMPWFKAISLINSSIDCNCAHFPSCRSSCYKLHQNMCKRLVSFVQTIYQDPTEQNYLASLLERPLASLAVDTSQKASRKRDDSQPGDASAKGKAVFRAGSDCSGQQADQEAARKKEKKSKGHKGRGAAGTDSSSLTALQLEDGASLKGAATSKHKNHPTAKANTLDANSVAALRAAKAKERLQDEPPMIKYLRSNVRTLLHCPMSAFLKGAIILPRESFVEMIKFSWSLLLEDDQQLSRTAAVCFIVSAIKCPGEASKLLIDELESADAARKIAAINKFYVVWDARYQCWPRLEDGAFVHFKMAPPSIEFTLPSPKIAQESSPIVDPPWMPRKTSNVEEVTIGQDQSVQKSFVTATKTRRKQQIEIVTKALREKYDKLREDREKYHITSVPVTLYAAFEPTFGGGQAAGATDELDGPAGSAGGAAGSGAGGAAGSAGGGALMSDDDAQENRALFQMKTAQALFPTCLCQSAIVMINLLDDPRVTYEGSAVYEIASRVIWSCLVEDPALFLRYFFERLTRQNQSTIFQVLRRLIRFMPRLPPQAAYTLYNYLIGFIIYYIRCPFENSQKLIADTLSVLCLVVPSVHGLFLKDLKQILRKEQCDHNLLITANVPSAKKIIIHGSDSSGIPSQFPIDESTQFYHILVDSLEFFGIEKEKQNEYFLIDVRTNLMHNLHSYVRDHYSFRRSQHPQLQLINMDPSRAFDILQRQELVNQFMEFGKVLMSLSIVKSSHMAVQRALFLHEELMKLPTFPRKALETNFSLFRGPLGHQVFSMDRIHKICWVRVIARMFELTSGFFLQLGDIQLFLNAISGIFVLHCEEASVSRLCLATFINATHQFKSIFATDGFMPIMATIVQVYSNHQNNQLLCRSIEFVCKQFYIMHRKPFLLQLFGSVASKLNTAEILQQNQISSPIGLHHQHFQQPAGGQPLGSQSLCGSTSGPAAGAGPVSAPLHDPNRISPGAFFRLLLSLEKAFKDPLDILELVEAEKPLRAVDFCYQQDKESIEILDIISLCVTVTAYASESPRSTQMLIILESVVPLYMKHLQTTSTKKTGQPMSKQAHKDELQKIQNISICIRTLIVNCEGLTRNFSGPLPSIDFRGSSIRRAGPAGSRQRQQQQQQQAQNNSAGSPMDIYADEPSYTGPELKPSKAAAKREREREAAASAAQQAGAKQTTFAKTNKQSNFNSDESEITRGEFIVPRDTLLNLVAEFLALSTGRLVESAKKYVELHQKHSSYELLDVKSHLRLAEVANSLLKFASTDPSVMACRGLIRYMKEILPNTEWRQEAIRPALIMILKRLDKTFNRIAKKNWVKKSTDWEAAKQLLKGAYLTFIKHPYIVHLPHLKSLISCCQNIVLSDGLQSAQTSSNLLHGFASAAAAAAAAAASASNVSQQQQLPGPLSQSQAGPGARLHQAQQASSNLLSIAGQKTSASSSPSSSSHHLATLAAAAASVSTAAATGQQVAPASQVGLTGGTSASTSFAAVTAAAALAERLAAGSGSLSSSTAAQGFNSVTIRLIAMQLLQTGDSQTLESLIGNSMNTAEKLESLMLNLIYPMCIRVCSGAREAPKLRLCDIMYILNIVLQMLAPQSASSKSCASQASSPKAGADNASQFILSKITTTIGSTQTGATALGIVGGSSSHAAASAHQIVQHQEALKIGFLGLKILCVCFESQLANEWVRIARVIRDLSLQTAQPGAPLWDFLAFVATYRFPMFILLLPTIRCNIAKKVREERQTADPNDSSAAHYEQCFRMIEAKVCGSAPSVCRSRSFLFVSLTAELRMLKEQLIAKRKQLADGERQTSFAANLAPGGLNVSSSSTSSQQHATGQAGAGSQGASGNTPAGGSSSALTAEGGDHLGGAYHRLSQAIASFANQGGTSGHGKLSPSAPGGSASKPASAGVSAIKNACFAAQLATSAPIGPQISEVFAASNVKGGVEQAPAASSIRLSTAKSREEARKVMNTILRRTSYPHNQSTLSTSAAKGAQQQTAPEGLSSATGSGGRKGSHPSSPSMQAATKSREADLEAGRSQLIMDPAMLMAAAFPAPRKSNIESSGILKQLVQTIDRQNNQRQQQQPEAPPAKQAQAQESAAEARLTSARVQQTQKPSFTSSSGQQKSRRISIQASHHHPKKDEQERKQ